MIRRPIKSKSFQESRRVKSKNFTGNRELSFVVVYMLIVQKSLKYLQLLLNEFFVKLTHYASWVTNSAFSQAHQKLSHTAFIELTEETIVKPFYADGRYHKFLDFRLVAVDGSKIILPNTEELCDEFGSINFTHRQHGDIIAKHPVALASVFYDVLNDLPIHSILTSHNANKVDLAVQQLACTEENDLIIFDRSHRSCYFLATLVQMHHNFVGRCSTGSFQTIREMSEAGAPESRIVTLKLNGAKYKQIKALKLPREITLRLVRVILDNGDVEVLVTSLLDEKDYPVEIFKELYNLRWGGDTFYGIVKDRLALKNFRGKSVESIKQDFYATIFISALESVTTEGAQTKPDEKAIPNKKNHPQQINKADSFNTIKNHVIELFYQ